MSPGKRRFNHHGRRPSTTEWLELLATEGPFLAAPVVKEVWPGGLPALDKGLVGRLRDASTLLDASPGTRDSFVNYVLADFLGWGANLLGAGHVPPTLTTPVPEYHTEVRPDFVLVPADGDATPLLLGMLLDPGIRATARPRVGSSTWMAAPADRMAHALRANKVPLGIVTDGTEWTLVCAPAGGATTTATWTRHTWADEPETLKAFAALLGRLRFFGVPEDQTLPALLAASLDRQEEITTRLSEQSQAVVEMLVGCIGRLDAEHRAEHGGPLLPADVEPADVYQAAVTVLMRLVFLLYAEERGLLPLDDDTYAEAYAASTLAGQLREHASDAGEDTLERSSVGWHRLLATFRFVHRGARHDQFNLTGYGGSLFDPDRFPWLEGRDTADDSLEGSEPLRIDDRTLLRALEALQWLKFSSERRRVSFRVLDVEQIGYVYEGLLDQDARRADDWILGIAGDNKGEKDGPELALTDLKLHRAQGAEEFAGWLCECIKKGGGKRTATAVKRALTRPNDAVVDAVWTGVLEACGGNEDIAHQILPFAGLLRKDPRELPVIYPPGSLYLTDSELRAHTGAVYTPRFLAEQVVERALEPLVKSPGPLDTENESAWKIRKPEEILALKVIDIAAGSGAFLVAATRFLADRLIEAQREYGTVQDGVEIDDEQAILDARRKILDHCIYGVDINPMAVEMAKLSLWLVTLDKTRPFGFLDDRLAVGDSLLGVTRPEQLLNLHLDASAGLKVHDFKQSTVWTADVPGLLKQAASLREQIADIELIDSHSADHKKRLLTESWGVTQRLTVLADALSGASLSGGSDAQYRVVAAGFGLATSDGGNPTAWTQFKERTQFALTDNRGVVRHPAHFPLLFPEVFAEPRDGFDAVVGNPPFLGGKKLTVVFGTDYREHFVKVLGRGVRGHADLIAYMFLAAAAISDPNHGQLGLIATNTIAQGDTREVGRDRLVSDGFDIRAAVKSKKWPTAGANLEYSIVWASRQSRSAGVRAIADDVLVWAVTSSLDPTGRISGNPFRLAASKGLAFIGSNVNGVGFTMTEDEARELISLEPRNADVVFPYIGGEDLSTSVDCSTSRWIVNFFDWSEDRARSFPGPFNHVLENVKPHRLSLALTKPDLAENWWRYERRGVALYSAIEGMSHVLAIARVSKVVLPVRVPTGCVFSEQCVVFATGNLTDLAFLSSAPHYWWAISHSSTLETRIRYTPSDVFETLARPEPTSRMRVAGTSLDEDRRAFMLGRQLGLTKTYNLVHDPGVFDADVAHIRELHVEVDEAVCSAYGWEGLPLDHGHYETRQGIRWTVSPAARVELLDRLLELNHAKYTEEQEGLLGGKRGKIRSAVGGRTHYSANTLFDSGATLFDTREDS